MWCGTFHHVNSTVVKLCTKFGSIWLLYMYVCLLPLNICLQSLRWTHLSSRRSFDDNVNWFPVSTFGHVSSPCIAVMHLSTNFSAKIYIQSGVIDIFSKFKMATVRHIGFCLGAIGPLTKAPFTSVKISSWSVKHIVFKILDLNFFPFMPETPIHFWGVLTPKI